jgi:hypothetical protein
MLASLRLSPGQAIVAVIACLLHASPGQATETGTSAAVDGVSQAQVRTRNLAIIGGGGLALYLYGKKKWWGEGFTRKFKSENEGWFGRNTYAGGADKLGHAYGSYVGTRLLARAFEWAGNDEAGALKLAAWSVLGAYTSVEVLDGFSRQWHFSREDALINAVGTGFAVLVEKYPALDRLVDFRVQYTPSAEGGSTFNPFGDYSGQIYLLALKATGVPALRSHSVLRYFELAFGYGAQGFDDGQEFRAGRSRNLYVGISLNLSEVLGRTAFRDAEPSNWGRRATNGFLEVVQVPGTAALAKHPF